MACNILITGGAGFIGSHVADELIRHGHSVRVLDSLLPQVHGADARRPAYLAPDIELIHGDVRDPAAVKKALHGVDAVFHFAARVGVGQSMYEIEQYVSVNNAGTAVLLEGIAAAGGVGKLVVASSMSIYGEGLYVTCQGRPCDNGQRSVDQLRAGQWDLTDEGGEPLKPVPTPEEKQPCLASVYALTKYDQERMCLIFGTAYRIPVVALRFFNVFGPRQSLSNPYTGVLAIFASRLLNMRRPLLFEDGQQQRDFVSVYDVAAACRQALEILMDRGEIFNVGSGQSHTVLDVANRLTCLLGRGGMLPEVTGKYRAGDIRHCFADITAARNGLGYAPRVSFDEGLVELAGWLEGQIAGDYVEMAHQELSMRGLTL